MTRRRAVEASFDVENNRIVIKFADQSTFTFPPYLIEGLEGATSQQISEVFLSDGDSIHWEDLDIDLHVSGLLEGRYGTERWMEKLKAQGKI